VNKSLPTQPHLWGEGEISPPRITERPALLPPRAGAGMIRLRERPPRWTELIKGQLAVAGSVLLLSVLCYYLSSRFIITGVVVQGRSMAPTLQDGARYFLNRLVFHYRAPRRGEVVVIRDTGHSDFAVKRIIGVPLDAMQIKDGEVFINGRKVDEPYLSRGMRTFGGDFKEQVIMLGKDYYFVMGDNRANSEDSRYYGPLHRRQIVGLLTF
jgi:signal peptidase I